MNGLELRAVRKHYQGRLVLDLDVAFAAGNLYGLLGANGSGKSTMLRLLALLERPEQGEVRYLVEGKEQGQDLAWRRRVVLVPDRKGLFNDTVLNNAGYGLLVRRVGRQEREARAEEALRAVGLWDLRGANSLALSTGEAQRLCLAMTLAIKPSVILLDEPTSSLDPTNTAQVENIIREVKTRTELIILVTHNIHQARRLADRLLFLHQGRLVEEAPAENFFSGPRSTLARKFLAGEIIC
jgi:tungstate transport system ATP-binding protein